MGVVHFLICGVPQHNILEKEVALKTTSADVTVVLRRKDSKKKKGSYIPTCSNDV